MLRERSRSYQKDQQMGHLICDGIPESNVLVLKHKTNSFSNVPGLFVGFSPKASESDSVKSPTSTLDSRVFSNLGNPFRSPRSPHEGHQKIWECSKVGLSIIDSLLDDETKHLGNIIRSPNSKNSIPFGPNFRSRIGSYMAPKSLPENFGVFPHTQINKPSNLHMGNSDFLFGNGETTFQVEAFGKILSCSLDSGRWSGSSYPTSLTNRGSADSSSGNFGSYPVSSPPQFSGEIPNLGNSTTTYLNSTHLSSGSAHDFIGSLSATEIERSEDYTCVKIHGPNPKTTHIFCDCILECHNNNLTCSSKNEEQKTRFPAVTGVQCSGFPAPYPSSDFLSFCYSCGKKLEGKDIFMYRGEKAFCSWDCRSVEISIEEAIKTTISESPENSPKSCDEIPEGSMFIAT